MRCLQFCLEFLWRCIYYDNDGRDGRTAGARKVVENGELDERDVVNAWVSMTERRDGGLKSKHSNWSEGREAHKHFVGSYIDHGDHNSLRVFDADESV